MFKAKEILSAKDYQMFGKLSTALNAFTTKLSDMEDAGYTVEVRASMLAELIVNASRVDSNTSMLRREVKKLL